MHDEHLPPEEKRAQRQLGRQRRGSLTPEQRAAASAALCRRVSELGAFQSARRVFTYAARGAEADLSALTEGWPEKAWYYPRCLPGRAMAALRPLRADAWRPGAFGIPEPVPERSEECPPEDLDLVLVPLTAFDDQCRRVGMGGGYYDRFLLRCTGAVWVGVAFACQRVTQAATEPWDQSLDLVVTEEAVYAPTYGRKEQNHRQKTENKEETP